MVAYIVVNKKRVLAEIREEIFRCKLCPIGKIGKPVPGEGNPNAAIVFVATNRFHNDLT